MGFPVFLNSFSDLILTSSCLLGLTCIHTYISYLPVERSLFQPHIKSTIMIIIMKQTELWYRSGIGIGRYPTLGIGIRSEVKKYGSVHPWYVHNLLKQLILGLLQQLQQEPVCSSSRNWLTYTKNGHTTL